MQRRSYEASFQHLVDEGFLERVQPMPSRRPGQAQTDAEDEAEYGMGVWFFRTLIEDEDLSNLTLPRTFVGRTFVQRAAFRNSDLSESSLCWNDFDSDMRGSLFNAVSFRDADLSRADLRHSTFKTCDFHGATMRGVKLTRQRATTLQLSREQQDSIAWQAADGEEPPGG